MEMAQQTVPEKSKRAKAVPAQDLAQVIEKKEQELRLLKEAQRKHLRETQEKEANLKALTKTAQALGWDKFSATTWKSVAPKITELLQAAQVRP